MVLGLKILGITNNQKQNYPWTSLLSKLRKTSRETALYVTTCPAMIITAKGRQARWLGVVTLRGKSSKIMTCPEGVAQMTVLILYIF